MINRAHYMLHKDPKTGVYTPVFGPLYSNEVVCLINALPVPLRYQFGNWSRYNLYKQGYPRTKKGETLLQADIAKARDDGWISRIGADKPIVVSNFLNRGELRVVFDGLESVIRPEISPNPGAEFGNPALKVFVRSQPVPSAKPNAEEGFKLAFVPLAVGQVVHRGMNFVYDSFESLPDSMPYWEP